MRLSELLNSSDWKVFIKILDNWKTKILINGIKKGETEKDLASIKAQYKTLSIIKIMKKDYKTPPLNTDDDPATTVPL